MELSRKAESAASLVTGAIKSNDAIKAVVHDQLRPRTTQP